jgi:hypothetical protein
VNAPRLLAAGAVLALGVAACSGNTGNEASVPPVARASSPATTTAPPTPTAPSTSAAPSAPLSPAPAQAAGTQVITYAPWAGAGTLASGISAAATQNGSCFTTSSATTAPGAYRCTVGNSLYDPCFADASSGAGEVACPNPANPDSVVVIKLTASLPAPATSAGSTIFPWLLVLANGQNCQTITGTGSSLGGKNEVYGCTGGGVYGQPDRSTATWTVFYAPTGAPASAITRQPVTKAYV